MSEEDFFNQGVRLICEEDDRYPPEAYTFMRKAVDYTSKKKIREKHDKDAHISTNELVDGIKSFALTEYGPMTRFVLSKLGIHSTEDFGNIIFNLIEFKIFGSNENDDQDDFKDAYSFDDAFDKPFYVDSIDHLEFPQLD